MANIATILLTHEAPDNVARMAEYWRKMDPACPVVVVYGGLRRQFADIETTPKVFVDDDELRTADHPRERQSYLGVMRAACIALKEMACTHVHFAEYDEIPLVADVGMRLLKHLEAEDADVIGHRLWRVDGTNHPHYLNHAMDPSFGDYWRSISKRDDSEVVLSMLGCGSFWTRESFEAVAALQPPLRIYLELMLPTAAHHLGFRVRPMGTPDEWVAPELPKNREDLERLRMAGAMKAHPCKGYWAAES